MLEETRSDMMMLPQNDGVVAAWDKAEEYFVDQPDSLDAVDALGYLFERKNPFMALPILSQVVYCLQQAALCKPDAESFKHIMRLAVNNGGDTDSIGAITGNILGAAWGLMPCRKTGWILSCVKTN